MGLSCWVYGVMVAVLVSTVNGKIPETDSFDESFEDRPGLSPELKNALQPAEDALFSFINRLVNTGYSSSKIALNRVEKASQKRKEFGEKLENFLAGLSMYETNFPVDDQISEAERSPKKPPAVTEN